MPSDRTYGGYTLDTLEQAIQSPTHCYNPVVPALIAHIRELQDAERQGPSAVPVLGDFTDRARKVLVLARREAGAAPCGYVGTEHLLLGLISEGSGVAGQALKQLGVSADDVRRAVRHVLEGAVGKAEAGGVA